MIDGYYQVDMGFFLGGEEFGKKQNVTLNVYIICTAINMHMVKYIGYFFTAFFRQAMEDTLL